MLHLSEYLSGEMSEDLYMLNADIYFTLVEIDPADLIDDALWAMEVEG
jgi:hypothetical protein